MYVMAIPVPRPSFLDHCENLGAFNGEKRWRSRDGKRIYTWDSLHGEIEVFNKRGRHLGAANALTGVIVKGPVNGRHIDV
ncbi:colicin E3/pyocin S6 family cytotoxin [Parasphingorhabdus sp.]|uniref:colicin E3/pyocin S6 family cytotoxin n=1 Tax=Parasphingorhabdus sp. TaxID=2709688 RepID=UPI0035948248